MHQVFEMCKTFQDPFIPKPILKKSPCQKLAPYVKAQCLSECVQVVLVSRAQRTWVSFLTSIFPWPSGSKNYLKQSTSLAAILSIQEVKFSAASKMSVSAFQLFCLWANFGQIFVLFFAPSYFFPIKMKKNLNLCNKIRFNWIFIWIKLALEFFPKVTVFSLLNRFRGGKTFHSLGCNYPLRIAASLPITPLKLAFRVKKERRQKWQTWIWFVTIIKFTRAQFFCLNATKS